MTAPLLWLERVDIVIGEAAGHSDVCIESRPDPYQPPPAGQTAAQVAAAAQYCAGIMARIALAAQPFMMADRVAGTGHICAECEISTTAVADYGLPFGPHYLAITTQTAHAPAWVARMTDWLQVVSAELDARPWER